MLETLLGWDRQALLWINGHRSPLLDGVFLPVAAAGEMGALWILLCLALLIAGRPEQKRAGLLLLATLIVVDRLINAPIGHAFHRDRPYLSYPEVHQLGIAWKSSSFPSGHSHSVWIATVILGAHFRRFLPLLILFALLTCYSRPYLGMHYPLDVAAGSLLGLSAGLTVLALLELNRRRLKNREFRARNPDLANRE